MRHLSHQAASGYLEYDSASGQFTLPEEQAMVLADPDSPVYLLPAFDLTVAMLESEALVQPALRSGKGVGWGDQSQCLFCTTGKSLRTRYQANLVSSWLPALEGVVDKLQKGAQVADVGCGHGFSTIIMAKAFPKSTFVGYDFHPASINQARAHAEQHGATANTRFEVGLASDYPAKDLDLVTFFDCLPDMGDPAGAARHVRESLKPDGSWMVAEPQAGDRLEDNLNPVGRMSYVNRRRKVTPDRRPKLTPLVKGSDGSARPGGAGRGCAAGASAVRRGAGEVGRSGAVLEAPALVPSGRRTGQSRPK